MQNNELCFNESLGRGVYLCEFCIKNEDKKWHKTLSRACKNTIKTSQQDLKEMIFHGKN